MTLSNCIDRTLDRTHGNEFGFNSIPIFNLYRRAYIMSHHCHISVSLYDKNGNATRYNRKSEIQNCGRQTGSKYYSVAMLVSDFRFYPTACSLVPFVCWQCCCPWPWSLALACPRGQISSPWPWPWPWGSSLWPWPWRSRPWPWRSRPWPWPWAKLLGLDQPGPWPCKARVLGD